MNTLQRIVAALTLIFLAACGTGEAPDRADLRDLDDNEGTLAAETAVDAAVLDDEPTSARFQLGTHYQRLTPTQPTSSSPGQVEVAEIFWYGCPHCFEFEPYLARWEEQKAEYVSFVRIPAVWNSTLRTHARAFYTADALGKSDEMHDALFAEIHRNGNPLDTREALAEFFGRFGVEPDQFEQAFDSFDVHARLQRAEELNSRYRITSVPSIVVNGKYTTSSGTVGSYDQLIELIDELAASERPGTN